MNIPRKPVLLALLASFLLLAGNLSLRAASGPQGSQPTDQTDTAKSKNKKKTSDTTSTDSASATTSSKPSKSDTAPAPAPTKANTPAALTLPASSTKPAATQQTPPPNPSAMVWVNTESGVYHKPGSRYYGKTKQGKYMTEADAIKAGYRASQKH
jgi:cytoskeletal protein RodZ